MKYRISKQFTFSASHQLSLPYASPCNHLHGHNYTVTIEVGANELNPQGMVIDYALLNQVGDYIAQHYDHRHLNTVLKVAPTAENIAEDILGTAITILANTGAVVASVAVSETPKTSALVFNFNRPAPLPVASVAINKGVDQDGD